jgi:hypothetical protein
MNNADIRALTREVLQKIERSTPKRRYTPDERRALGISRASQLAARRDEELAHLEAVLTAISEALDQEET